MSICLWQNCRRVFTPRPDRRLQQYCSKTCANRMRAEEIHHEAAAKWPQCAWCQKRFQPAHRNQQCCSRICGQKRRSARCGDRVQRTRAKDGGTDMVDALPPPLCFCGAPLCFGSDSMTGVSLEYCPQCRVERPLAIQGMRGYDQRPELERELVASVDRAQRRIA